MHPKPHHTTGWIDYYATGWIGVNQQSLQKPFIKGNVIPKAVYSSSGRKNEKEIGVGAGCTARFERNKCVCMGWILDPQGSAAKQSKTTCTTHQRQSHLWWSLLK
jgi:hypothetical protein